MKAKKIILFIVEGVTDKTCLGYILDQLLSDHLVKFQITDGDVTTLNGNNSSNISAKIGNIVRAFSDNIFKPNDFLEIVHLVDMDGAYISEDKVVHGECEKPFYTDDNILTNNVIRIQIRNKRKSDILNRLITLNRIWGTIPYSAYFFSCNLDHVLHNNPNLSRQGKNQHSERFEKEYAEQPSRFVEFLNNRQYAVGGSYLDTWNFIKIDTHSLQRFTNFHLYFCNPKNDRECTKALDLASKSAERYVDTKSEK